MYTDRHQPAMDYIDLLTESDTEDECDESVRMGKRCQRLWNTEVEGKPGKPRWYSGFLEQDTMTYDEGVYREVIDKKTQSDKKIFRFMKTPRTRKKTKNPKTTDGYHKNTKTKNQQNQNILEWTNGLLERLYDDDRQQPTIKALVLDDEYMRTSDFLQGIVFAENIDVPNNNEDAIIRKMTLQKKANVYSCTMGEYIERVSKQPNPPKYTIAYFDYCGAPGKVGVKNQPLDDIDKFFGYKLAAENGLILAFTGCCRSSIKNEIGYLHQNLYYTAQQITVLADKYGYDIRLKKEYVYTDTGSQSMFHLCYILIRRS